MGLREGSGGFWIATCLEWFFLQEIPASRGTLGGPTLLECFKTWKLTDKKKYFLKMRLSYNWRIQHSSVESKNRYSLPSEYR